MTITLCLCGSAVRFSPPRPSVAFTYFSALSYVFKNDYFPTGVGGCWNIYYCILCDHLGMFSFVHLVHQQYHISAHTDILSPNLTLIVAYEKNHFLFAFQQTKFCFVAFDKSQFFVGLIVLFYYLMRQCLFADTKTDSQG